MKGKLYLHVHTSNIKCLNVVEETTVKDPLTATCLGSTYTNKQKVGKMKNYK